ncbi:TetR/AcrR family transcriptional regulator [Nocardia inohanensis]|uniref:TetR/AcrR family transcriptional regulator n=1 Tax=Nocardia inohanensis TaxID=209246 RepID=UPI0009FEFFDA|nr:TetR/AcrR family transcriptional regulator [Nocardia inohanensis]
MPRPPASHGRTGRPPVTSRAQILTAARQLIDRDGWEKLTIRRLATEIGIGATTLYRHIQDKDDLLVLLLNHYADQADRPTLPDTPHERIIAAATAMHDTLAGWPWAAEVLTVDGFVGLLDESALWMVESIIAAAEDAGRTPDQAVHIFRTIWYYTVGEILVHARSTRRADSTLPTTHRTPFANLDPAQLPHLAALAARWPALAAHDTYPQGLRALVEGLLAQADSPAPN